MPISGYALLGVRQKTTDDIQFEGAGSFVAQAISVFVFSASIEPEQNKWRTKDIYLVTSAHSHVNNKDSEHFSFEKTLVKLFTQASHHRHFGLQRMRPETKT